MTLTNAQRQAKHRVRQAEQTKLRHEALMHAKGMMHSVSSYIANGEPVPFDLVHAFLELEERLVSLFDTRG